MREGIEIAVDEINRANPGSVSVIVDFEDSSFKPTRVHTTTKKLIANGSYAGTIVSTYHEIKPSIAEYEKHRLPALVLWDSCPELDQAGDYIFSIGPWAPSTGETAATFLAQQTSIMAVSSLIKPTPSAVIINHNHEWSLSVSTTFKNRFESLGGKVLNTFTHNPTDSDYRTTITRATKLNPDTIYAPLTDGFVTFFRQLREAGFSKPVLASDNLSEALLETAPEVFEGVFHTQPANPNNERMLALARTYRSKFGKFPDMPLFLAWGYDAVHLFAKAYQAGGRTLTGIKDGFYQIADYPGASGSITISASGSWPLKVGVFKIAGSKFIRVSQTEEKDFGSW